MHGYELQTFKLLTRRVWDVVIFKQMHLSESTVSKGWQKESVVGWRDICCCELSISGVKLINHSHIITWLLHFLLTGILDLDPTWQIHTPDWDMFFLIGNQNDFWPILQGMTAINNCDTRQASHVVVNFNELQHISHVKERWSAWAGLREHTATRKTHHHLIQLSTIHHH